MLFFFKITLSVIFFLYRVFANFIVVSSHDHILNFDRLNLRDAISKHCLPKTKTKSQTPNK